MEARQPDTLRAHEPETIILSPTPVLPGPLELPEPAIPIDEPTPPTPVILPKDPARINTPRVRRGSRQTDIRRIDNIEEARRAIIALAHWQWHVATARERDLIRDMSYNVLYRRFE